MFDRFCCKKNGHVRVKRHSPGGYTQCCTHQVATHSAVPTRWLHTVLHSPGGYTQCCTHQVATHSAAPTRWLHTVLHSPGGYTQCCTHQVAPGGRGCIRWPGREDSGTSWGEAEGRRDPATPALQCPQRIRRTCHRLPRQPPSHGTTFKGNSLALLHVQPEVHFTRRHT